jgi:hypothetical protein
MPTELERIRLEKQRVVLLGQLRGLGNLMRGSVVTARVKCGNPRCECAEGLKHAKVHLSVNLNGRTRVAYVGEKRAEEVEALLAEYRRAWRLIEELTKVNLELLRPTRNRKAGKETTK